MCAFFQAYPIWVKLPMWVTQTTKFFWLTFIEACCLALILIKTAAAFAAKRRFPSDSRETDQMLFVAPQKARNVSHSLKEGQNCDLRFRLMLEKSLKKISLFNDILKQKLISTVGISERLWVLLFRS